MKTMKKYMKRSKAIVSIILLAALTLTGCIKNDLPYPRLQQNITAISAEGETQPALIDSTNLVVTLYLSETTDPYKVKINEFRTSPGAIPSFDPLTTLLDLSTPKSITLQLYQTYQWTIKAEWEVERYLTIAGQIGESVFDEIGKRIIVRMPSSVNLSRCELTGIKLGPEGHTVLSPLLIPGTIDLSRPLRVSVTYFGHTEDWTIYTEKSTTLVQTTQVDAWSQVIWAYGEAPADMKGGFQYRKKGDAEWTDVPASSVTQAEGSGSFSACIPHLTPLTTYEVRAIAGKNEGNIEEVTTQSTEILPDGSFDQWWKNGNVWCPWNEGGVQFWDTGNKGAATLGESNVTPTDDTPLGTGQAAQCATRFVGISVIGKLAAGSIYTGTFAKVDGTNGILDFGRPWTVRPTRLKGYYKYVSKPIDYTSSEFSYLKGRPDTCCIYIALTDWTAPYQIRTNPKNRQLFDANAPEIIAYGELKRGNDTNGWEEFTIELKYRSTSRTPRYIQITNAASKYGDFFTGGTGSVLTVDQLSLEYDY